MKNFFCKIWREISEILIYIISGYIVKNLINAVSYIEIKNKNEQTTNWISLGDNLASYIVFYLFLIVGVSKYIITSYYNAKEHKFTQQNEYQQNFNNKLLSPGTNAIPGEAGKIMGETSERVAAFSPQIEKDSNDDERLHRKSKGFETKVKEFKPQ